MSLRLRPVHWSRQLDELAPVGSVQAVSLGCANSLRGRDASGREHLELELVLAGILEREAGAHP